MPATAIKSRRRPRLRVVGGVDVAVRHRINPNLTPYVGEYIIEVITREQYARLRSWEVPQNLWYLAGIGYLTIRKRVFKEMGGLSDHPLTCRK